MKCTDCGTPLSLHPSPDVHEHGLRWALDHAQMRINVLEALITATVKMWETNDGKLGLGIAALKRALSTGGRP